MKIKDFFEDIVSQNRERLISYFCEDARIYWHCTNEEFTLAEYIQANCDYPGQYKGEIERLEELPAGYVLVGKVQAVNEAVSCHVTSFITLQDDKVLRMDEYWADDGPAPQWRQKLGIGKPIK